MKKVAVILSGCGYLDGSEIHESVLCLLALSQAGMDYQCFAPDIPQAKVVNHLSGQELDESRNVLQEAARIARGNVLSLSDLRADDYDAILIPGGFGAAMNLCGFAMDHENYSVDEGLRRALWDFHKAQKPIGATCIAPVILAKSFEGKVPLNMTLGQNEGSLEHLARMGMQPQAAAVDEVVLDEQNKVYTTPCYMEPDDLAGMFEGVCKVVSKIKEG